MAPPSKSGRRRSSKERESDETPSLNLWVGDLAPDTVDSDLMAIFGEYGAMDALTSYTPRTYAFVFFRNTEDAKKAKDGLRGSVVRGSAIRIEFARSVCSHLWSCNRNLMCIEREREFGDSFIIIFNQVSDFCGGRVYLC